MLDPIFEDLEKRVSKLESIISNIVGLEKNNLDRLQSNLILASRIFGEHVTIEQCLNEIDKLKELGMTEIE